MAPDRQAKIEERKDVGQHGAGTPSANQYANQSPDDAFTPVTDNNPADFTQSIAYYPDDQNPAGMNFTQFGDNMGSADLGIIDQCLEKHFHIMDTLKSRHQRIKNILDLYNPHKNLSQTISALEHMNNIGVTHDTIKALFVDDAPFVHRLTMKQCNQAMPKCIELVES